MTHDRLIIYDAENVRLSIDFVYGRSGGVCVVVFAAGRHLDISHQEGRARVSLSWPRQFRRWSIILPVGT
jgi:hypothetical protein